MVRLIKFACKKKQFLGLRMMDGTSSKQSYAVVARRGDVFLGIKFSGLAEGAQFGLPDRTYLSVLLRNARNQDLATELDLKRPADNVVEFVQPQLGLDAAWPNLSFDRVDDERASVMVGLFIHGSLDKDIPDILARIRNGDLFRKLVAHAIAAAGPENCIVKEETAASWLSHQAAPTLRELRKRFVVAQAAVLAKEEFAENMTHQGELIAPHNQNFKAVFQRRVQERLMALQLREMYDDYPPPS
jgi:hypothetical protein